MTATTAAPATSYVPRLKHRYDSEIRARLKEQLGIANVMQVPRLEKIVVNMGVGDAITDAKVIEKASDDLARITGQKAQLRRARKSIAQFKLRAGMPVGVKVTLRGDRMWDFFDRLLSLALPRIRDFRGLPRRLRRRGQLQLRRHRAADLPRDRLRPHRQDPRPGRRDRHHRRGRRPRPGAARGLRLPLRAQ